MEKGQGQGELRKGMEIPVSEKRGRLFVEKSCWYRGRTGGVLMNYGEKKSGNCCLATAGKKNRKLGDGLFYV